jgi:Aspartyl/Asparaginyl beta-hydroxylase
LTDAADHRGDGQLQVPDRLLLALPFDAAAIATEAAAMPQAAWIPHFNLAVHDGGWFGITLRGPGGDASRIYPDPTGTMPVADTPMLARCPAVRRGLANLGCPVLIARFLSLEPGGHIRPHHDDGLSFLAGTVRLHVPILSAPEVTFELDGRPVAMGDGECWYLDFEKTHAASNRSSRRRIHLVIDCEVNAWLTDVFIGALASAQSEG